jgi:hypothetical protein
MLVVVTGRSKLLSGKTPPRNGAMHTTTTSLHGSATGASLAGEVHLPARSIGVLSGTTGWEVVAGPQGGWRATPRWLNRHAPMTDIVEQIKVEKWTNRDGEDVTSYRVSLVNETGQREVPCYSPLGKDLKEDAPLPEGWEVKTSKAGKPYLAAPRLTSGGGERAGRLASAPTAWRNTEAGAKYEQERMDRRTALMQAVAIGSGITTELAEKFYAWLRESV